MKFAYNPSKEKSARAFGRGVRVSTKSSQAVCKAISGMRLERGKALLQDVLDQKRSLDGKYYTNTTKNILDLIKSAEANAESRGLDTDSLHIHATAHKGFSFFRPRGFKRRRERAKVTNLQVVLEAG
jgi:large subunit ribosomal protein L22